MADKKLSKKAFEEIVVEYKKANKKKKEFENILNKFKPSIRTYIEVNGDRDKDTDKYELATADAFCELRPSRKNKSQEEMIAILNKYRIKGCTKKVEVVDEEALETAALQDEVSKEVLKELQKTSHSLYVK